MVLEQETEKNGKKTNTNSKEKNLQMIIICTSNVKGVTHEAATL